jgi:tetratricopeptide (TPR) repeat protein
VIDHFARILDQQRRLEDGIGGRPLLPIITRQLETVRGLRCAARGHLVDEVLSLASSHAQFVAWMHQDTGNSPRAVEFYSLAHDMATEAGDADMAATALSMKAHVAWSTGDALRCQRFGEAAAAVPRVSPVVEGMAVQMAARGYAMERDPQARRVLDRAFTLLASAADAPDWMYFYGEAWLTLQAGMLEAHLHNWPRAVELYRAGLDQLPEHYVRDRAWYLSCLVRAEVENDNPDAALEAARTALPLVREVNRPYGIREIERATAKLLRKRLGEARDLQALLRDAPT